MRCGTVNVNEAFAATFASIECPWAGCGSLGRAAARAPRQVLRYTETQSVAVQRLLRFGPAFGMDDKTYAQVMTANLRLLRKVGRA